MSELAGRVVGDDVGALQRLGHDLRQAGGRHLMLATVADLHPGLPDEVRERLDQIRVEARRISDVCRYLLGELDGLEVADLRRGRDGRGRERRVTSGITIELVAAPVVVRANSVEVWRALANLVDNACRAAGPDGTVRVEVSATSEGARLEVHDSGPGWGEGPPGTASLGLSIVASTTAALGGRMETGVSDLGGAAAHLVFPSVVPAYLDLVDPGPGARPNGGR